MELKRTFSIIGLIHVALAKAVGLSQAHPQVLVQFAMALGIPYFVKVQSLCRVYVMCAMEREQ